MNTTHSLTLYGHTITLPTITQDYAAIRKIAAVRASAVIKKLQLVEQNALHLVAAFSKIRIERITLATQEIDYYYSQGRLLQADLDEALFRQQAEVTLQPMDTFEQQILTQFEEAKRTHNLAKINDEIFTKAMLARYYQTIYNTFISLHTVYVQLAADVKYDNAWALENLPFQQWQEVPIRLQAVQQQPTKENVIALLMADPYHPTHIALAYALFGNDNKELQHFLTAIGYTEAIELLPGCETAAILFGEHNAAVHLALIENPLFFTLVTENAFQTLEAAFDKAIEQFSDVLIPYLSQQVKQEKVLFAYTVRKSPILMLTKTGIRGKGRWFKTLDIPYEKINHCLIRDGLCQLNQTTIAIPHFEHEDDEVMTDLIGIMQVITAIRQKTAVPSL